MAMNVTVSSYLLEDIFRLIDYLDRLGDHDDLYFHKLNHSPWFGLDTTALWELKLKIKRLQAQVVETYLTTVDDVTDEERLDLRDWVAAGNSIFENPCHYCDEKGNTMDYITAMRDLEEQLADSGLLQACPADGEQSCDEEIELPF
jgi:hypothetical protein